MCGLAPALDVFVLFVTKLLDPRPGEKTMAVPPVGLQCIVFGKKYQISDPKVMDRVAKYGYKTLECGVGDAKAFKAMLDERGLKYGGMHTTVPGLADVGPMVEKLGLLQCRDVCNSGLFVWEKIALDDYRKGIAALNEAGRKLKAAGIALPYHNHAFEFEKVDGDRRGIDILLAELDPACVDMCVDVGWVTKGGDDPVAFLKKHVARVGYLHLKDYDNEGWTELGSGVVNIAGVVKLLPSLPGVRQVMYEQDSSRIDPLESVERSRTYLKEKLGY
jgi:sugar phosphate isomerase/epimerase